MCVRERERERERKREREAPGAKVPRALPCLWWSLSRVGDVWDRDTVPIWDGDVPVPYGTYETRPLSHTSLPHVGDVWDVGRMGQRHCPIPCGRPGA